MSFERIKEIFINQSDGFRVVLLIHRSKEGGFNNTHKRHLKKIITRNSEEFFIAVSELIEFIKTDDRDLRIYASVNCRNINKAIRLFKQRQLDNDYTTEPMKSNFYIDIKNRFISCLMDKSSRDDSNFLFDLDGCDDRSLISIQLMLSKITSVLNTYKTKNGYHIITSPFNYVKDIEKQEIKDCINVDGLSLIYF